MKSLVLLPCLVLAAMVQTSARTSSAQQGIDLYKQRCAICHDAKTSDRAPDHAALQRMSPQSIVRALETGSMRAIVGAELTPSERELIAEYLTGKSVRTETENVESEKNKGTCPKPALPFS